VGALETGCSILLRARRGPEGVLIFRWAPPARRRLGMGLFGISKSQVSKLCKDIDERVNAFLDRPIKAEWPYLWLDATYLKVRDDGRIVSAAAIIAVRRSRPGF
jgi:Transposase, Mutator family